MTLICSRALVPPHRRGCEERGGPHSCLTLNTLSKNQRKPGRNRSGHPITAKVVGWESHVGLPAPSPGPGDHPPGQADAAKEVQTSPQPHSQPPPVTKASWEGCSVPPHSPLSQRPRELRKAPQGPASHALEQHPGLQVRGAASAEAAAQVTVLVSEMLISSDFRQNGKGSLGNRSLWWPRHSGLGQTRREQQPPPPPGLPPPAAGTNAIY